MSSKHNLTAMHQEAISSFYASTRLSDRERQIVQLAVHGLSDKELSTELELAYTTIKTYWGRIYSKLAVPNRQRAIASVFLFWANESEGQTLPFSDGATTSVFSASAKTTSE